jgi:hypothetical protein
MKERKAVTMEIAEGVKGYPRKGMGAGDVKHIGERRPAE